MHSTDNGAVLNGEGASASASFVEWIARQSAGVGQNMSAVASGVPTPTHAQSQHLAAASIAPTPRKKSPAPHAPFVQQHVRNSSDSASSLGTQPMLASEHDISSSPSLEHGSSISGGNAHLALGQDITVQPSMLNHYVNLSPFIDQGAYTVSENISARRVWALFRSLGMRHIVVLNHSHQPVGVITRRDLIRFAVAQ
jgi:hypothetical protein